MNGLPRWYHPMFNWERFSRVTNDGFFLVIEARDPRFTENGSARTAGTNRRPTHHHGARGLNMLRGFLSHFSAVPASPSSRSSVFAGRRAPARRSRFSPTWCDNRKFVHKRRSIFCRRTRSHVFRSQARCRLATRCQSPALQPVPAMPACRVSDRLQDHGRIRISVSATARIITTPARWATLGNWHSSPGDARVDGARTTAFQHQLARFVTALTAAGNGITKQYGLTTVVTLAGRTDPQDG